MISSSELAGLFGQSLDMYLDSCIVVGDDGTILLANQRVRRDFGYKPHELVGKSIETLVPERFLEAHRRGFAGFWEEPTVLHMDLSRNLVGRRKDGSELPLTIGLSPAQTDSGLVVLAELRDMSEQRRAEQALQPSEQRHRALIESAAVAIVQLDRDLMVEYANPALCELLEVPDPGDLIGTSYRRFYKGKNRALLEQAFARRLQGDTGANE